MSSKKNFWVLITHANALLQSCLSKRRKTGTFPIWNSKVSCVTVINMVTQRCWFLNIPAQLRGHGSPRKDVQRFLFGTTVVMAVYAPDSKKSLEMYEECISSGSDVYRWKMTARSQRKCMVPYAGKGTTKILAASKNHVMWDYERI